MSEREGKRKKSENNSILQTQNYRTLEWWGSRWVQ